MRLIGAAFKEKVFLFAFEIFLEENFVFTSTTNWVRLKNVKSESKKIGHFLLLIIWYWEPSEYFWIKKGQNDLFQALKWGIVCLSTSNGSRDMTKRNNSIIWNFHDLV